MHERNSFLTLTYDEEHFPADGCLDIMHWQLFAKRLRKRIGRIRFFMCGEYGERTYRPHYHVLLFGYDFANDRFRRPDSSGLYSSPTLDATWQNGACYIGDVTFKSAAYVARYTLKKTKEAQDGFQPFRTSTGEVVPEFINMSRNPGIGSAWFDRFKKDVYPSDEVVINGSKYRPPGYYDRKLSEKELRNIRAKRRAKLDQVDEIERSSRRLATKERILVARNKLFRRDIH